MAVLRGFAGGDRRGDGLGRGVRRRRGRRPAEELAQRIQAAVLDGDRPALRVGIGDNLLRAKIATEFGKARRAVHAHRGELGEP